MNYISTRGGAPVSPSMAILRGIAPDGGLYIPEEIPQVGKEELQELLKADYPTLASVILGKYLTDYSSEELTSYAQKAYSKIKFPTKEGIGPVPLTILDNNAALLELYHGPTCAFKDMALQMLPYLLTAAGRKNGVTDTVLILVATSGDTGKAALEGFRDVDGSAVFVYYPRDGVSAIQKLQMITQEGKNVGVSAVAGNFDDAQTGVKEIFADAAFAASLKEKHLRLSSANSINWGRLVPQIVYYFHAWLESVRSGFLSFGDTLDITVPTGNFGNILAAWYAKKMGLPLGRLICASNSNNVLTDFISTGVYDKNRPFLTTVSPSMDILISSNVERLLYYLSGKDGAATAAKMQALKNTGKYALSEEEFALLKEDFSAGYCSEEACLAEIGSLWKKQAKLVDPHTAVGLEVLRQKRSEGEERKTVLAATASPFKFSPAVLEALDGRHHEATVSSGDELAAMTGEEVPAPLRRLDQREKRFTGCVEKSAMREPLLALQEI